MIKPKEMYNNVELSFWELTIPLLDSESLTVKKVVNVGYNTLKHYKKRSMLFKTFFWASLGLSFGLTIGLLEILY